LLAGIESRAGGLSDAAARLSVAPEVRVRAETPAAAPAPALRKILYLVTEDWYFWSHRLPFARAMRDAGVEVVVACRVRSHGERIAAEGFALRPLAWRRRGDGPIGGLRALAALVRLYRRERPDLVHHIALKPAVFGSLAALLAGVPRQVSLIAGLGFVFVAPTPLAWAQRTLIMLALRLFAGRRGARVIVQNEDDRTELLRRRVFHAEQVDLVAGSGVDLARFHPTPPPAGPEIVGAMVCRMLRYKGVEVAVQATRLVRRLGVPFRLLLVGPIDPDNPASHSEAELRAWCEEGAVEWIGAVDDVPSVWRQAHLCLFPSIYREGVPKALIEAAACGRPIIAADISGCRDVVAHEVSGILTGKGEVKAVARAIIRLCGDAALRARMGKAARLRAETLFSEERVVAQTLDVYARTGQ
jgi:glycosyltransferase involved in cell wall biosynthesis